jgi:hypothetical protein
MPDASVPSAARNDAGTDTRPFLSRRLTKLERKTAIKNPKNQRVVLLSTPDLRPEMFWIYLDIY